MIPLDTTTGTTSATKWLSGLLSIPLGILVPLRPLLIVLVAFIAIDFITGLVASWHRGEGFCSKNMWRTIYKCAFAFSGVVMMHLLHGPPRCILRTTSPPSSAVPSSGASSRTAAN